MVNRKYLGVRYHDGKFYAVEIPPQFPEQHIMQQAIMLERIYQTGIREFEIFEAIDG